MEKAIEQGRNYHGQKTLPCHANKQDIVDLFDEEVLLLDRIYIGSTIRRQEQLKSINIISFCLPIAICPVLKIITFT
jgi:hypothetical protein